MSLLAGRNQWVLLPECSGLAACLHAYLSKQQCTVAGFQVSCAFVFVFIFFFLLGVAAAGTKECYGTQKRKHSRFPHFSIWFPCRWLSCERLILLHPVLHSCAAAGCIPACWRKYYSFYPFPEGKSPSVVHLITAGYCDWNFHYNSMCQGSQCGLFWSLTPRLPILLAHLVGQETISPPFPPPLLPA